MKHETTLETLASDHTGRGFHKWSHYLSIYDRHFYKLKDRPITLYEIGVGRGGSLQLWRKFFQNRSIICGIDVRPGCRTYAEDSIYVRIGHQSDTQFLSSIVEEFGAPDIIIDDGSHVVEDVVNSFNYLYPKLRTPGVYVIEDAHTAYDPGYGGGYNESGTISEKIKEQIDFVVGAKMYKTSRFQNLYNISVYPNIIVLEKDFAVDQIDTQRYGDWSDYGG